MKRAVSQLRVVIRVTRRLHADRYTRPFVVRSLYDRTPDAAGLEPSVTASSSSPPATGHHSSASKSKTCAADAERDEGANVSYRTDKPD